MISAFISLFENILAIFKSVTGPYVMFGLFLASVIYIVVTKSKKERCIFVYITAIILLLFFNPIVFFVIGQKILGDQTYCRMLWAIPQVPIMAYAFSEVCDRFDGRKVKQAGIVVLCVLSLMISGHCIYNSDNFSVRENAYGLSDEVVTLVNAITPYEKNDELLARVSAVPEVASQIRQVSTYPRPRFDRDGFSENGAEREAYQELIKDKPDVETLIEASNSAHAYIIIRREQDSPEFIERGCFVACETENYIMYCLDNIEYTP